MMKLARALLFAISLAIPFMLVSCNDDNGSGPEKKAELSVLSVTFDPADPTASDSVTATITVRNTGTANAPATRTRVRVDGVATCAEIVTPALTTGANTTVTCDLGPRAEGNHTVEACADITNLVSEGNDANNCISTTLAVGNPPANKADLLINEITIGPANPTDTTHVTVTVKVKNNGAAAAGATHAMIELDGVITCAEVAVGTLAVGAESAITCDLGTLTAGEHHVRACADTTQTGQGQIDESDETNNCDTQDFTVTVPGGQAELSISSITFSTQGATVTDSVQATITIQNTGSAGAPASQTRVKVDGVDNCAEIDTPAIPAGGETTVNCDLGRRAEGDHPVEACADVTNLITETNDANNCMTVTLSITPTTQLPDLAVTEITFDPAEPTAGDPVTATITVKNQGTGAAVGSKALVVLDGVAKCADVSVAALVANAEATFTCEFGPLDSGIHVVRVCADTTQAGAAEIDESNETNNCMTENLNVTGIHLADLSITLVTIDPPTPNSGNPITASVTIRNQGNAAGIATTAMVTLDGEPVCGEVTLVGLGENAEATITCDLGTLAAGPHVLEACADTSASGGGQVPESNELNNCEHLNFDVTAAGTDIPDIGSPTVVQTVDFGSADQYALQAQAIVNGLLVLPSLITSFSGSFFGPLSQAEWTDLGGGCHGWSHTEANCTSAYRVCEVGTDLTWEVTVNGTCPEEGGPYTNWVATSGTTSLDGTTGTFRGYEPNSTTVSAAWTFTEASDGKSGTWTFYQGDVSEGVVSAVIDWAEDTAGQDLTFTTPEQTRLVMHIAANLLSGTMAVSDWNSTDWVVNQVIEWDNPHGTWTMYDDQGTQTEQHPW